MKTNQELRNFIDEQYFKASEINSFSSYISYQEKNELIRRAKYYRKAIIQKEFPAFRIHCKDEQLNELVWVGINKDYSLEEVILILIADNFYMTRQQIRKYIKI